MRIRPDKESRHTQPFEPDAAPAAEPATAHLASGSFNPIAPPPGASKELFGLSLIGPVSIAVYLSITAMALLMFSLKGGPVTPADLTNLGRAWWVPERDSQAYVAGCALLVVLTMVFTLAWNMILRHVPRGTSPDSPVSAAVVLFLSAIAGTGVLAFLIQPLQERMVSTQGFSTPAMLTALFLPALLGAAVALCTLWIPLERATRYIDRVAWVAVPLLVFAILYVPHYRLLAGAIARATDRFSNWDFFVMGPATGYVHGQALGTDICSRYGIGWPMILGLLAPVMPLSYSNTLHVFVLYGCAFFIGVFALVRLWTRNALWAGTAALFCILLQMFNGMEAADPATKWAFPSSTVMRYPCEIWLLIAALMHLRTGRLGWGLAICAIWPLAVVLETDTGICLAIVSAVYMLACLRFRSGSSCHETQTIRLPKLLRPLLYGVTSLGTTLLLVAVASRGTFLSAAFWSGWFEPLTAYGTGFGDMRIDAAQPWTVSLFLGITLVYLAIVGWFVIQLLRGESSVESIIAGLTGLCGLADQLRFVTRSHEWNLYHSITPFCILIMVALACMHEGAAGWLDREASREKRALLLASRTMLPGAVFAVVLVALIYNPAFRNYPGLLNQFRTTSARPQTYKMYPLDVGGFSSKDQPTLNQFRATVQQLERMRKEGAQVAILDEDDTCHYLAAGLAPWCRYSPFLTNLVNYRMVANMEQELRRKHPKYVLIRNNGPAYLQDVVLKFIETMRGYYQPAGVIGPFEYWVYTPVVRRTESVP